MTEKETFEASLRDLEKAVEKLESGDMPLEEAMSCFEAGVKAAGTCQKLLKEAELKIEKLRSDVDGSVVSEPFEAGNDGE